MLFRVEKKKKSGYDLNGSFIPATVSSQNLSQCLVKLWKNSFILSNTNVSCCRLTSFPIHCRADRLYGEQLVKNRLEKQTVRWTEKWLNCQAERIAASGRECSWGPVSRGKPQGWGQVLFALTSSFITSTLGQRVSSASLQVTQDLRKQLMHQRVVQASKGTLTLWRNGLVGISWSSAKGRAESLLLSNNPMPL